MLDSGAFSELSESGEWHTTPREYAEAARRYQREIGNLQYAAIQDWMCEPWIVARTGLSVREHQNRTLESFLELKRLAPEVPWIPILQGWEPRDYEAMARSYGRLGVDLEQEPLVGLGTVCRRQHTREVGALIRELRSIPLHGFGLKLQGLAASAHLLASADSMAWSFDARRKAALPGCSHRSCANCLRFALDWRQRIVDRCSAPRQLELFV
jgi:hypothetical protein